MNSYKEIIIFYFSGTGNSKQIANWLSEFASIQAIGCSVFDISKSGAFPIDNFDKDSLICIISPIHGFNYPKITLDFIRNFPKGNNKIVLMNTRAGMKIGRFVTPGLTGVAFLLSSILLKIKGYKIVGQIPFDMPSNWISIHPALTKNAVKFLHEKNYNKLKKHAERILLGRKDFLALRDIVQDLLISPVALLYYFAGRFLFAKSFYANTECDDCGLCIKQCPVNAIKLVNEKPYWAFSCESCMKCMNSCPNRAIETAHTMIIVLTLISSSLITFIINNLGLSLLNNGTIRFIVLNIFFFLLLGFFYYVHHKLLQNRIIGKFISLTSFTHYKFWGRYNSIRDKEWKNV